MSDCGTCRFATKRAGPEGPRPEVDHSKERHGLAKFFFGSGVDDGSDMWQDLYWARRRWDAAQYDAKHVINCHLLPTVVVKRKNDWCSHYAGQPGLKSYG